MLSILASSLNPNIASGQDRRARLIWLVWILGVVTLTGVLGLGMLYFGTSSVIIGWVIFFLGILAILYQPRYGVYLILFLALLGDNVLTPWYPFVKNFSSAESIFYLTNGLIISPLEVYLVLTAIVWLGKAALQRKFTLYKGPLFWPAMLFTAFWLFGIVFGLLKGGSLNIGLWEARPIIYLPIMLVLVSNLITSREQVNNLLWFIMVALLIEGIFGVWYFFVQAHGDIHSVAEITEHASAVHMNTLFVLVLAAWVYKASPAKRYLLPLFIPVVAITYLVTQRRAAFLGLFIALLLMAIVLFIEKRRLFWKIVPPIAVLFALYCAAFWNSNSSLGLPVEAIKSVVDQKHASLEDQASNAYRVLENINASFTIHNAPLTGVGFGRKFYILVNMPDISNFQWWQYITHNSIVWIWMKTGIGGFLSLLILIGMSLIVSVRALLRMPGGDLSAIALTIILYFIMHYVYAYVDMSWDSRSMLYVGAMMGLANSLEHIVSHPVPLPKKRWPWQPDPQAAPGLKPLP
jgi:hypothetical protein